jgi:hypothetical protein
MRRVRRNHPGGGGMSQDVNTNNRQAELGEHRMPHAREEVLVPELPALGGREDELVRASCI